LRQAPGNPRRDVRARVEAKIADIEAKIKTLQVMKDTLQKMTQACARCAPASECPILESMDGEEV